MNPTTALCTRLRCVLWVSALLPLSARPAAAAEDVPLITITKSDKIGVGLNGISGPDGGTLLQLVQRDLMLAGAFSVSGPNTGNYQVSGSVSGSSLHGVLADRSGKQLVARS
jgi:hypothetical protein